MSAWIEGSFRPGSLRYQYGETTTGPRGPGGGCLSTVTMRAVGGGALRVLSPPSTPLWQGCGDRLLVHTGPQGNGLILVYLSVGNSTGKSLCGQAYIPIFIHNKERCLCSVLSRRTGPVFCTICLLAEIYLLWIQPWDSSYLCKADDGDRQSTRQWI